MCQEKNYCFFKALLENDVKVLEEIYDDIFPVLKNYIVFNSGSEDDAWDLFQEALIVLLRMAREEVVLKGEFRSYLLAICRNKWLKQLRQFKNMSYLDEQSILISDRSIALEEEESQMNLTKIRYNTAVNAYYQLPERCQKILSHVFTKGKKIKDKDRAEFLGINYNYFRKEKCKCKKILIEKVKESFSSERELKEEL